MRFKLVLFSTVLIISSCAIYVRPIVLEPTATNEVYPYYTDGIPVAVILSDSSLLQLSIQNTSISSQVFARLWVNYTNNSQTPLLLEPQKTFKLIQPKEFYGLLDIEGNSEKKEEILPELPSEILHLIEMEKSAQLFANAFVGIAESVSRTPTTFYSNSGAIITVNDLAEKKNQVAKESNIRANSIVQNYNQYLNNVNSIFLRKNTVFPGQSVTGFVFFKTGREMEIEYREDTNIYSLESNIGDISLAIEFKPVYGE